MSPETDGTQKTETELLFSMQNLLDASTFGSILKPIKDYRVMAEDSGYGGIEFFPWRIPSVQIQLGLITAKDKAAIKVVHQSYRSERSLREVWQHPNRELAALAFLALPERIASLKLLKKLQGMLPDNIPIIIYPYHEWRGEEQYELFPRIKNKLVQTAPELLDRWQVKSAKEFVDEVSRRGFDGICLDLFHLRCHPTQGFTTKFKPWQESIPVLLPHTKLVHLGIGRTDSHGNFDSMEELKDIYTGARDTDIIPVLEMIRDANWNGPIVTQIPARSIGAITRQPFTPSRIVAVHGNIVENLSKILAIKL